MDRNLERTKPVQPVSAARRRLWQAVSDYVHGQGGWVTSVPFARFVRIEVKQGSPLPVQLEKAGHRLHHAENRQRWLFHGRCSGIRFIGKVTGRINVRFRG